MSLSGWPSANDPPGVSADLWPVSVEAVAYPSRSAAAMPAALMLPAQPPFPTATNFPFQPSAGSHSSISIWESEDGASTANTRQWAGLATIVSAVVMVVWGSDTDASRSQGICAEAAAVNHTATAKHSADHNL